MCFYKIKAKKTKSWLMKKEAMMLLSLTDHPVRNDHTSAESKITKSQPENDFYNPSLKLMPNMWHLLLKLLEIFLHAVNLHLQTLHQKLNVCSV